MQNALHLTQGIKKCYQPITWWIHLILMICNKKYVKSIAHSVKSAK